MLGDDGKKQIYHRFGIEGLKNLHLASLSGMSTMGGGSGMGMGELQEHILKSVFGSSSPFSSSGFSSFSSPFKQQQQRRQQPSLRNHDVAYTLQVTLEDLYNETNHPLLLSQHR